MLIADGGGGSPWMSDMVSFKADTPSGQQTFRVSRDGGRTWSVVPGATPIERGLGTYAGMPVLTASGESSSIDAAVSSRRSIASA